MALLTLVVDIVARTANLEQSLARVEGRLNSFATTAQSAFAGLGVAAIVRFVEQTIAAGAALERAIQLSGASAESFQRLSFVANATGVSTEALAVAISRMGRNLSEAGSGSKVQAEALAALGLSFKQLQELKPDAQFIVIGRAIASLGSPMDQARASTALFGRSWQELFEVFKLAQERFDQLARAAPVMSPEQLRNLQDTEQAINAAKEAWKRYAEMLAGDVTRALQGYEDKMDELQKRSEGKGFWGRFWEGVKFNLGGSSDRQLFQLAENDKRRREELERQRKYPGSMEEVTVTAYPQKPPGFGGPERKLELPVLERTSSAAAAMAQKALADIRGILSAEQAGITYQETILNSLRDRRLVSEKDYYAKRHELIQTDMAATLDAGAKETQARLAENAAQLAIAKQNAGAIKSYYADAAAAAAKEPDKPEAAHRALQAGMQVTDAVNKINELAIQRQMLLREQQQKSLTTLVQFKTEDARITAEQNRLDFQALQALQMQKEEMADYITLLREKGEEEWAALQLGPQEIKFYQERLKVTKDFDAKQRELNKQFSRGDPAVVANYDQLQAQINASRQQALAQVEANKRLLESGQRESPWRTGAMGAFNEYLESATNVAAQVKTVFLNAFTGMENSLVNFVKTGKFSFRDLASSIIEDLARMTVRAAESQVLGLIFGLIGSGVSGGSWGSATASVGPGWGPAWDPNWMQKRQHGGPVSGGRPYLVGEAGPEWFVPTSSGAIQPAGAGGMSFAPTYNIDARGADAERIMSMMPSLLNQASEKAKRDILTAFNRHGLAAPRAA